MSEALPSSIRAFIAVELNDEVRQRIASLSASLRKTDLPVRWVSPENLHVTLAFLGNVTPQQVEVVVQILENLATEFPTFGISVGGIGTFGPKSSPRVLWVGVEDPSGQLATLHRTLTSALERNGLRVEDRAFHAHVTLGRFKGRPSERSLTSLEGSDMNTHLGSVAVERIVLMRSDLGPEGPRYSVIHAARLKGATKT